MSYVPYDMSPVQGSAQLYIFCGALFVDFYESKEIFVIFPLNAVKQRGEIEMKRKIIAFLISLLMLLSMTACGGDSESGSSVDNKSNDTSVSSGNSSQSEEKEPEQPKESYEVTYSNARTYTNSIGTTWVQAIVEIENTGSENLYLSSGAYDLEDADGNLIASKSMVSAFPDVIAPGEKGYMYEETTLDEYSGNGNLVIIPRPDVKAAKVDLIRYNISDVTLKDDKYNGVKVLGRIENQTSDPIDGTVYIAAFFYNEEGNPIGSAFTILNESIDAGDKIGFEFSGFSLPDDVTVENIENYKIYSYPLRFQF